MLDHRVHFASLHTSQRLLDYLQSSAVVLELWGLQGEDNDKKQKTVLIPVFTENVHLMQTAQRTLNVELLVMNVDL